MPLLSLRTQLFSAYSGVTPRGRIGSWQPCVPAWTIIYATPIAHGAAAPQRRCKCACRRMTCPHMYDNSSTRCMVTANCRDVLPQNLTALLLRFLVWITRLHASSQSKRLPTSSSQCSTPRCMGPANKITLRSAVQTTEALD